MFDWFEESFHRHFILAFARSFRARLFFGFVEWVVPFRSRRSRWFFTVALVVKAKIGLCADAFCFCYPLFDVGDVVVSDALVVDLDEAQVGDRQGRGLAPTVQAQAKLAVRVHLEVRPLAYAQDAERRSSTVRVDRVILTAADEFITKDRVKTVAGMAV
jgi:hypothetical protein